MSEIMMKHTPVEHGTHPFNGANEFNQIFKKCLIISLNQHRILLKREVQLRREK